MQLLVGGSAGLLLDPGMGKTPTTLGAYEALRSKWGYRMLVVAPIKPMYDTWPRECQKWDDFKHLRCTIVHGPADKRWQLLATTRPDAQGEYAQDIVLINPEGLGWYLENTNPEDRPEILCIDESTKFKNSQSKRFKGLRKELEGFYYRWILTGTIVPNGLMDLWSQVCIIDNGEALGPNISYYRNKYFYRGGYMGYTYTPKDNAEEQITSKVKHMILRLNAEDYLDMPDLINVTRSVKLPKAAFDLYKDVESAFFNEMQHGTIVAANAAAAGTKCRQIANGACYVDEGGWRHIHNAKMAALDELVEEIGHQPMLVVYEFKHDQERLLDYFGDAAVCITGASGNKLQKAVDGFNAGEIPVLLAHAGSLHGMNIQGACRHMVWFGITWNLESYQQAVWRLYRQGQKAESVMVYHLVGEDTLDETVVHVLGQKEATQNQIEELLSGR
jgi:SNF2 family DNA or RNA helicase